jgi:hypothetical protein
MQAEKILAMVAKEARAAGILAAPHQLELVAAPTATGDNAALMTMHYWSWRLAHHHVNDSKDSLPPSSILKTALHCSDIYTYIHLTDRMCILISCGLHCLALGLKRTASLARFLDKRKQRQEQTHAIIIFLNLCHAIPYIPLLTRTYSPMQASTSYLHKSYAWFLGVSSISSKRTPNLDQRAVWYGQPTYISR